MNPDVFAEWLRRQGHRVVRTPSTLWYEASARVLQAFPFHWTIQPEQGELDGLLRSERVIALRCSTSIDAPEGRVSYHVVCDDDAYGLETLDARARNAVRNGLARAQVQPIPLDRVAEEGWTIEADTCRRQGRDVSMSPAAWRRRHLAAADLPGFEAWGALVDGRLVACLLSVRIDDWCEVLAQQSLAEYLPMRVNNALTYAFTRGMLQRGDVSSIFYTLESLDAPPSVDDFKFRMGYSARPVRQRVAFHPWARPAIGRRVQQVVSAARRHRPSSKLLRKTEGMLRFYLEGKLPPEGQKWPGCIQRHGGPGVRARTEVAAQSSATPSSPRPGDPVLDRETTHDRPGP